MIWHYLGRWSYNFRKAPLWMPTNLPCNLHPTDRTKAPAARTLRSNPRIAPECSRTRSTGLCCDSTVGSLANQCMNNGLWEWGGTKWEQFPKRIACMKNKNKGCCSMPLSFCGG
jgi:hypothetical protein